MVSRNLSCIYFVGAGPGDPALLTLKAKAILEEADIVFYDYLVHPSIFSHCKQAVKLICVGKKKGEHSVKQSEINTLLVDAVKEHPCVVRLKGGDPLVFGRLGEEVAACNKAKIPFQIVPGISSATAAPASAGVFVTQRESSHSVAFVTGTTQSGQVLEEKYFPSADTLVVLMALNHLDALVQKLLRLERFTAESPAALISHGTLAKQQVVKGTLNTIVSLQDELKHKSPTLMVVGEVVKTACFFNDHRFKPLWGKRICLFRPQALAESLQKQLMLLGSEVLLQPLLDARAMALKTSFQQDLAASTTLIFTSQQGVSFFFKALYQERLDIRMLSGKKIYAVGRKTAKRLAEKGLIVAGIPKEYSQQGILDLLDSDLSEAKIFLPLAKQASPYLKNQLQQRAALCFEHYLYESVAVKPVNSSYLVFECEDIFVFTSSEMVKAFLEAFPGNYFQNPVLALGPLTARACEKAGFQNIQVATAAHEDAVLEALLTLN